MAQETPKGVSSRLLTMKFMQRAAASASSKASTDPDTPSKKRKLDSSSAPGRVNPNIDQALIQAALDEQEANRLSVLKQGSAADTHWVHEANLAKIRSRAPMRSMNIVYVGYGDIDQEIDQEFQDQPATCRTSTKHPKRTKADDDTPMNEDASSQTSETPSDEGTQKRKKRSFEEHSSSTNSSDRSHSHSRSRPGAEAVRAKEFRDKRRKKEVRLNRPTSISSGATSFRSRQKP